MTRLLRRLSLLPLALLAACATAPTEEPARPISDNTAVVALVDSARTELTAGQPAAGAATLERALRIEPRNAALWHELAKLRLSEGQWQQAESLAAKSNGYAGDDHRLRAANWRLIAETRERRNDPAGAQAALQRAGEYE